MTPPSDFSTPVDVELLLRYVRGDCTPEEREQVVAAMTANPRLAERVSVLRGTRWNTERRLKEIWETVARGEQEHSAAKQSQAVGELQAPILMGASRTGTIPSPKGRTYPFAYARKTRGWIGAGGVVLAALLVTLVVWPGGMSRHDDETRTYVTGAQQQATVHLSDGTTVALAPRTTVRLVHFGSASRAVVVEGGEAYFDVAHAEGVPFLVHSGAVTARVLGTRFLLRHDAGTSHTRVAVTDGKILVNAHAAGEVGQTLTAGHIADVIDSTMRTSSMDDLTPGTEWVQGKLVFYHVPVSTVLATLSRWYGYQFRYADSSLSQRSVTIAVSMQSSATALATLEQILSVNVVVKGDTVVLAPQPSPAERGNPQSRNYDVWMPTREVGR